MMRRSLRLPVLLSLSLPAMSALLLGAGCGEHEEGTELALTLEAAPQGSVSTDAQGRHFTLADGRKVTLTRGWVTLSSVELLPCVEPASVSQRPRRLHLPAFSVMDLFIGTAHAHTGGTPTKLGSPHVLGLDEADGTAMALGALHPPVGRFCAARLAFSPADDDAHDLPTAVDMVDRTLRLEGQVVPAGGGAPVPFTLESDALAGRDVTFAAPLELSESAPSTTLRLALAYDRWLEGVALGDAEAGAQAVQAVSASASQRR
ncbi:hypothetical protein FGE12_22930 [Aggregicoccus sp. 17bor-14]|uniref:hypothetical protein n=1 Tax=Myxococcaceae TaxID=31 RepID=UPI00129C9E62|nr:MULTISPECIES: hypothetical protein [Myxococcaceae]MBF5045278.1 hypothetical protein [Simulacricoccus sp. 17bor-14]MRI91019.1 hypothetical protein [Aggregicoccus sp. 17bor-14]